MSSPDFTENNAPDHMHSGFPDSDAAELHATIQSAAREAVQDSLETHRRLGRKIAVQKSGEAVIVDSVENLISENEQTPPHVA